MAGSAPGLQRLTALEVEGLAFYRVRLATRSAKSARLAASRPWERLHARNHS